MIHTSVRCNVFQLCSVCSAAQLCFLSPCFSDSQKSPVTRRLPIPFRRRHSASTQHWWSAVRQATALVLTIDEAPLTKMKTNLHAIIWEICDWTELLLHKNYANVFFYIYWYPSVHSFAHLLLKNRLSYMYYITHTYIDTCLTFKKSFDTFVLHLLHSSNVSETISLSNGVKLHAIGCFVCSNWFIWFTDYYFILHICFQVIYSVVLDHFWSLIILTITIIIIWWWSFLSMFSHGGHLHSRFRNVKCIIRTVKASWSSCKLSNLMVLMVNKS